MPRTFPQRSKDAGLAITWYETLHLTSQTAWLAPKQNRSAQSHMYFNANRWSSVSCSYVCTALNGLVQLCTLHIYTSEIWEPALVLCWHGAQIGDIHIFPSIKINVIHQVHKVLLSEHEVKHEWNAVECWRYWTHFVCLYFHVCVVGKNLNTPWLLHYKGWLTRAEISIDTPIIPQIFHRGSVIFVWISVGSNSIKNSYPLHCLLKKKKQHEYPNILATGFKAIFFQ